MDQAVLVVDLDQRHRGVFGVGEFRVGVAVREQLARVLLLRLHVRRVEEADGVRDLPVELVHLGIHAVADAEAAADQQVQVGVDSLLLQPGDEVIQAIQRIGVPVPPVAGLVMDQPGRAPGGIEKMEPHGVQAELGHPRGHLAGRFVVREVGAGGEIRAEEPQAMLAGVQVAVLDVHETGLPRGLVQRAADIGGPRCGVIPRRREGHQVGGPADRTGKQEDQHRLKQSHGLLHEKPVRALRRPMALVLSTEGRPRLPARQES